MGNIAALNQIANVIPKTPEEFKLASAKDVTPSLNELSVANCQYLGMVGHKSCGWCLLHNKPFQICEDTSLL